MSMVVDGGSGCLPPGKFREAVAHPPRGSCAHRSLPVPIGVRLRDLLLEQAWQEKACISRGPGERGGLSLDVFQM